jgi:hypothetical protein
MCLLNADMSLFLGTTPKKMQWVSSVIAPCIHTLAAKWEVVVSFITPPIKPFIYCFIFCVKEICALKMEAAGLSVTLVITHWY